MTKSLVEKKERIATVSRTTKETDVTITVNLDKPGDAQIATPIPFFSHMLEAFACHGQFSVNIKATGDIEVDPHHLIEDVGIVLGEAIFQALDGLKNIERAGSFAFPMDGSLALVAIDLCGRRNLTWDVKFGNFPLGGMDPNLFKEFFKAFVDSLRATVHVRMLSADNDHHVIESIFKALSRALRQATRPLDSVQYLSTKGVIDAN
jgi:imidazoleglycerol-phosphate dehydratase